MQKLLLIGSIWALVASHACAAASTSSTYDPNRATLGSKSAKLQATTTKMSELLLFSDRNDVRDVWGKIRFGVTPLEEVAGHETPGFKSPHFSVVYSLPEPDGSWTVYGATWHQGKLEKGVKSVMVNSTWELFRAVTRDGLKFENVESVFKSDVRPWSPHCAIAYNPVAHQFLLLRLCATTNGFAYMSFGSPDGRNWKLLSETPDFYESDAESLFWNPVSQQYIVVTKTLQPAIKHFNDHGGITASLHNDAMRDRRCLCIRTSRDGLTWEPNVSETDLFGTYGRKSAIPVQNMTMPDENDPPDLEFYSGNAFWYVDRCYMMVLNYAASPLRPRMHGPFLDTEWWVGRDGLHWDRPARDVSAAGRYVKRIGSNPIVLNGMILFHYGGFVLGMKQDRLSYVGAKANAEFSTVPFQMPQGDLLLNAAVPAPDRAFEGEAGANKVDNKPREGYSALVDAAPPSKFDTDPKKLAEERRRIPNWQAYVMVSVLDEQGKVVPGFESENCLFKDRDQINLPLLWDGKSARELAGRKISLHFMLRSSNIYAVTFRE